ncbi:MAG: response regulator [Clostridia bacterium]|nr:response regulator [Clostridia bacterium]
MGIKILEAQEEERRRLSRDIHDGPAQSIANIVLKAEICKTMMARDVQKGLDELEDLKNSVRLTLQDIILLDVNLPDMTGIDVLRTIKAENLDTKVIMITADGERETLFKAIESGAQGYILKDSGLLGRKRISEDYYLVISPCNQVHMMAMAFPIDVVYVDGTGSVLDMDLGLKPWTVGKMRRKARWVIEAHVGYISDKLQIGDCLRIENKYNSLEVME